MLCFRNHKSHGNNPANATVAYFTQNLLVSSLCNRPNPKNLITLIRATVRSIVGQEFSEMDVIKALHMANNDATAAINIIFDTPNFSRIDKPQMQQNPRISSTQRSQIESLNSIIVVEPNENSDPNGDLVEISAKLGENSISRVSNGGEWWFVGYGEIAGMSTSKGRKIKIGEEVEFAFPSKNNLSSPSPSRFMVEENLLRTLSDFRPKAGERLAGYQMNGPVVWRLL